jgi:hypothetical protein
MTEEAIEESKTETDHISEMKTYRTEDIPCLMLNYTVQDEVKNTKN